MNPVKRRKIAKRKLYFEKFKAMQESKVKHEDTVPVVEKVVQEENLNTSKQEVETIELALELIEKEKIEEETQVSKKKKKSSEFTK